MLISFTPQTQTFQAKYPTEKVINFVAANDTMRKADCINFIHTILSVTKDEHKAMMRPDNIEYQKQLTRVVKYLLKEVPELGKIVDQFKTIPQIYKKNVIEKAEAIFGNNIEIKRMINHKRK